MVSSKTKQNPYYQARIKAAEQDHELNSRVLAADRIGISLSLLEKCEAGGGRCVSQDVVMRMADVYGEPQLLYGYCTRECPVGKLIRPEVRDRSIEGTVLALTNQRDALADVCKTMADVLEDGTVDDREIAKLSEVEKQVDKIAQVMDELRMQLDRIMGRRME